MKKNIEVEVEDQEKELDSNKTLILEDSFKIDQGSIPGRYTLYIKKIINKGKANEREDWILCGYDFYMPTLFKKLTHILTDKKIEKSVKLKEYVMEYNNTVKYLEHLINL